MREAGVQNVFTKADELCVDAFVAGLPQIRKAPPTKIRAPRAKPTASRSYARHKPVRSRTPKPATREEEDPEDEEEED